ncbi:MULTISPECIES: DUF4113 domain-containing protein [Pseudescherichia]|uniref:DUF4113 domain-containing protein n=1 Tax=Pseudescherichia TaxID=2055880 RepID=UPI00391703DD
MALTSKLNRPGKEALCFTGQGSQKVRQMKREMFSPQYTMRWAVQPNVRAK